MKKLLISLSAGMALLFGTVSASAGDGLGFGVALSAASVSATGTETEGGEKNSTKVDNHAVGVGSVFAEYTKGFFTVGIDYVPFDLDVSDATKTRSDTETSVTGTKTATTTSRTQSAQAEISDHLTAYIELGSNAYVKAGLVQVTVNTNESLGTGSKYNNVDVLCINESELRFHYRSQKDSLPELVNNLLKQLNPHFFIITQGKEGSLSFEENKIVSCPTFSTHILDRIGAGDTLHAITSLCFVIGIPLDLTLFIGNLAASEMVSSIGTGKKINKNKLLKSIESLFK